MKTKKIENYLLTANKVKKTDDNMKMLIIKSWAEN